MTDAVLIRACEERDLDHFGRLGSDHHVQYCRDHYARGPRAVAILVAVDAEDLPVGKLHLDFEDRAGDGTAVLHAASVTPQLQGGGIGTELMRAAERCTCERGFRAIELGVEDSNRDARRFHERLGYRRFAAGDFPYTGAPTPNPGAWMRKDLQC